jgi:rhodanese-related sulfurtransferase
MVLACVPAAGQEAGRGREPVLGRIAIEDFIQLHAFNGALVLDVRGTDAYRAGHIPGAVHVPLDQIEARAEEIQALVKHRAVVTYCSCPEEHASLVAVRLLDASGVPHASALVGGYPAWVAKGGKIEKIEK